MKDYKDFDEVFFFPTGRVLHLEEGELVSDLNLKNNACACKEYAQNNKCIHTRMLNRDYEDLETAEFSTLQQFMDLVENTEQEGKKLKVHIKDVPESHCKLNPVFVKNNNFYFLEKMVCTK